MDNELISVYIPTHNRSALLKRALNSALNQSYKNVEIIVVDDGSKDDTKEIIQHYLNRHNNIIYLRHEQPKGACAARNYAISAAKGKYITGLDDDDEFLPHHLETLFNAFDDSYAFVASSLLEDVGGSIMKHSLDCGIISLNSLLHYNKVGNQVFTLTSRMREINGFDESFPAFQDYDTWVRLVSTYGDCKKLKTATYIWHTGHEQGRITNDNKKRLEAVNMFLFKHSRKMSNAHKSSNYILVTKIERNSLSLIDLLRHINLYNYKMAISLFINSNLPVLGSKWRKLKGK
ncbi:glycosyltransferase [Pseudoalteromonas prydzensis]|uniref:Glycosyltransferase n=1 Tax=Pseudoalteromonas prydzensis TaxID=182141 RepID=A0ABR9FRN6_9GAMM|nr:glycosyltransferase [Pseudoalteromonas prydzensis]MBE0459501.1 glycosyltransferase [Pseudoalteromonas prydzensis]